MLVATTTSYANNVQGLVSEKYINLGYTTLNSDTLLNNAHALSGTYNHPYKSYMDIMVEASYSNFKQSSYGVIQETIGSSLLCNAIFYNMSFDINDYILKPYIGAGIGAGMTHVKLHTSTKRTSNLIVDGLLGVEIKLYDKTLTDLKYVAVATDGKTSHNISSSVSYWITDTFAMTLNFARNMTDEISIYGLSTSILI